MERSDQVATLRAQGLTPKEIARRLGMRPAEVTALVQANAGRLAQEAGADVLAPVVGCFVNRGWSTGLGLDGAPPDWSDGASAESGARGLVNVLVARRHRYGNVVVCGYLVDVFCLGVKDSLGPKTMSELEWRAFVPRYFQAFDDPPLAAPIELAQCLVHGAVAYAHSLGFEPHADFARSRSHVGAWQGPVPIAFGESGRPMYCAGPRDDSMQIIATLRRTVGAGNFDYIAALG
jgi:hypothetical protein